jgi:hypothetical protein
MGERLLKILEPMMADFKCEIAKMRSAGATEEEIGARLDRFEEIYAPNEDPEGKLVMAVLREAARPV